ncbi:type I restriction enzyme, S subunit [Carnobacterium iners]|uniref:Type I restriction enzyme, S subunit n=1 Tax=Carnobacterium iners TaxID=1073423 RepID=A0A1X7MRI5_9LACT|nr:restriction endonuclease subunit S [Carnobacterium iners]SEL05456.1 type I restriction enzyme, S subunit [Carnobacterium iners]SMH26938.1 type I restriction enzyme, S subunit [Carnobacterium iners]
MNKKKLVPNRRFEEFNKKWEERILKDFRDKNHKYSYTGGPFGSDLKSEDYTKKGVRIIQLQNIGDGIFLDKYKIYTSESKAKTLSSNLIYPEEIIIAKMAEPLARAAIIPGNYTKYLMSSDGIRLKVNTQNYHTYFILTLINDLRFRKKALQNSTGTTRKRIGLVTLGNLSSYLPNYREQQKIGEFFKHLDQMISLEQHKLEKKKALKSAYLVEMFPAEDKPVPKRRFPGFKEKWIESKLKDISEIVGGGTPSSNKEEFWNGNIDWYSPTEIGNEIYVDSSVRKITEIGLEKSSAKILPANKTILFTSRAGIGSMAILKNSASTNQGFQSIILKSEIDTYFIYSMGYLIKSYAISKASGSTFLEISGKTLGEMPIFVPIFEEQQAIGEFFKKLDDKITNQQQKLDKLKAMKQAYLQEMFV